MLRRVLLKPFIVDFTVIPRSSCGILILGLDCRTRLTRVTPIRWFSIRWLKAYPGQTDVLRGIDSATGGARAAEELVSEKIERNYRARNELLMVGNYDAIRKISQSGLARVHAGSGPDHELSARGCDRSGKSNA